MLAYPRSTLHVLRKLIQLCSGHVMLLWAEFQPPKLSPRLDLRRWAASRCTFPHISCYIFMIQNFSRCIGAVIAGIVGRTNASQNVRTACKKCGYGMMTIRYFFHPSVGSFLSVYYYTLVCLYPGFRHRVRTQKNPMGNFFWVHPPNKTHPKKPTLLL